MKTNQYTQLSDIPKGNYQGYLWNASAQEPTLFYGVEKVVITNNELTPIIEGLLYDKEQKRSIHIVYTHRYIITEYEQEDKDVIEDKQFDIDKHKEGDILRIEKYMPHNKLKKKVESIKMARVWKEDKEDEIPTLSLVAHVFRGFNLKK